MIFERPLRFVSSPQRPHPALMALSFDFSDPTQRIEVLFLISNMLVNKRSDFLALGFLTIFRVLVKLGLSPVI